MPNWKKLITSGSNASLNSLTVVNGITGSLSGTASFAVSSSIAVTSSFALSASQALSSSWAPINAGGSDTQIQFNSGSHLLGTGSFTFNYLNQSLQQGFATEAKGQYSHAEGSNTLVIGDYSHAEGVSTTAEGEASHAEGNGTIAEGDYSHAEGNSTIAEGDYSHAEGNSTTAKGEASHAEGKSTIAEGDYSHAEGSGTTALGGSSHAEGESTTASGSYSHAEGNSTTALGSHSHAEGRRTTAEGEASHAEGVSTTALGSYSHAEGNGTIAEGDYSHAEGESTQAIGNYSHTEGAYTIASGSYQHVQGQYNIPSTAQSAFIIGNGISNASRSNLVFASGSQFQITGSVIATQGFTGSLFGTASFAVSSSRAVTSSFAISSSFATTASFAVSSSRAISSSFATTASFATQALSASFASNGGVTQLLAGPNVTLSPTNGLGQVTVGSEDNLPLISKSTYLLIPNIDNTIITVIGKSINISGANIGKTWSSSSYLTRQLRIGYLSTATAGTFNSLRQINGYFSIGQGFKYLTGFGGSTGFDLTQSRAYIGVTFSNNTTGNVEQDTMINSFGVGRLYTSDNWWIMHNDASGIATKVDTGFLANTVNTLSYYLSMETVGSNVKFIVTQIDASGAVANTFTYTATSDLPALDFALTQRVFVTNNTNSSIVTLDWFGSKIISN
jgi:hypothetical protein